MECIFKEFCSQYSTLSMLPLKSPTYYPCLLNIVDEQKQTRCREQTAYFNVRSFIDEIILLIVSFEARKSRG